MSTDLDIEWRVLMGFDVTTTRERGARAEAIASGYLIRDGDAYLVTDAGKARTRELNLTVCALPPLLLAPVARAIAATEAEHAAARDTLRCPICGAAARAECTYGGPLGAQPAFPGRVHTRRLRAYLATLTAV